MSGFRVDPYEKGWMLASADVVRGKIRELRIVFGGNQYRLLYCFAGKQIVITHGFVKKTGPVPVSELDRAERLMQEWHQHGA